MTKLGRAGMLWWIGFSGAGACAPAASDTERAFEACAGTVDREIECDGEMVDDGERALWVAANCDWTDELVNLFPDECAPALADYWECEASSACDASSTACAAVEAEGAETCPDLFGICGPVGTSPGDSADRCTMQWRECSDGRSYVLECDGTGCTCSIDGMATGHFDQVGACGDDVWVGDLVAPATAACGWPNVWPRANI